MTAHHPPSGYIELERTVESILVGQRHRTDYGDLDELAASIEREGLLQPITITPDGVLVCGARRLAAIRKLGWKSVNVWVRSGISDRLGQLLAEQDDNVLHKPLTPLEAAALYRELKTLMAEDAARRQATTRFSSDRQPVPDGVGKFPTPSKRPVRADEQAAAMIPGGASYKTHEKISYLQQIADNTDQPADLRERAKAELAGIEDGAPVDPAYRRIRADIDQHSAEHSTRDAQLHQLAADALARIQAEKQSKKRRGPRPVRPADDGEVVRYPVRAFVHTWTELADWWTHYDIDELARELDDEQFETFLATVEGTRRFAAELRAARTGLNADDAALTGRARLRAL
ncbi:ParB N-terminal domain-containing protein [Acidipropionibacterium acidipropionici]|uniref:ParB N-terminal domain-containing protein n=1 Tax=Acidipropionibacterium acidipropionici TaxID=1748 RepID=UPI00040802B9|nr:ParB N-terminal domain-containing protein [Acidipropionibacterium acidipropionici]ALN13898.1 chromosome partitioning protein ParB [Acidipropionibacterium acidipropionici]APZ10330.1 chromosome partitioning protein ParB [Acidipropionibacterium acidipropionici]